MGADQHDGASMYGRAGAYADPDSNTEPEQ